MIETILKKLEEIIKLLDKVQDPTLYLVKLELKGLKERIIKNGNAKERI